MLKTTCILKRKLLSHHKKRKVSERLCGILSLMSTSSLLLPQWRSFKDKLCRTWSLPNYSSNLMMTMLTIWMNRLCPVTRCARCARKETSLPSDTHKHYKLRTQRLTWSTTMPQLVKKSWDVSRSKRTFIWTSLTSTSYLRYPSASGQKHRLLPWSNTWKLLRSSSILW